VSLRFTLYHSLILGLMLIAAVLALPDGLMGGVVIVLNRLRTARVP
ncbi:MAG: hypothetical protein HY215_03430, partial [Candidatus Rokubacteria bacterium]|nr:hypothetical protein [Candidatus Rokubacteria bacterium]